MYRGTPQTRSMMKKYINFFQLDPSKYGAEDFLTSNRMHMFLFLGFLGGTNINDQYSNERYKNQM